MTTDAPTPTETELKLAVRPVDLPRLRRRLAAWGPGDTVAVDSVYADTPERHLAQRGVALRVRRLGRRWVQTLKSGGQGGALSVRGEWEVPLARARVDLAALHGTPAADLVGSLAATSLQPMFRTRFSRTRWYAEPVATEAHAGARVEIALDQGEIVTGIGRKRRSVPLCELELELQQGDARALLDVALRLGAGRGAPVLRPLVASKAARGERLRAGAPPPVVRAHASGFAAAIDPAMSEAQALRATVGHGVQIVLGNVDGWLQPHAEQDGAEFVHQARVALRRMRSALRLLDRGGADFPAPLTRELRWLGTVLGAVRDLDVALLETLPALQDDVPAPTLTALARALRQRRRAAQRALRTALQSQRFALLALGLLRWSVTPPPKSRPLRAGAARRLARLRQRLLDAAAFFGALEAPARHEVRIRAKRLRYALDLCTPVLPAAATAAWTRQLAKLQDRLGAMNDAAVAATLLATRSTPVAVRRALLPRLQARIDAEVLPVEAALLSLARSQPPWEAPLPA